MGFMNLEKAYDTVNRQALWQVLRMYDVGGKLLSGLRVYVTSLACVRVKVCFRSDSGDTRLCHVPSALQCVYGCTQ